MIAKKNKKANLERKRFAFFQIGLLVSGSLVLAAFEYSTVVPDEYQVVLEDDYFGSVEQIYEDQLPVQPQPPKPQPRIVNYENVDSFDIKKELTNQNQTYITSSNNFIDMGDMGDPFGDDFDWSITEVNGGDILPISEVDPEFPGGFGAMTEWIGNEVEYPELCKEMGIGGIVYVQFVVNTDGSITNVKTLKSPHDDLSNEAMRVVRKMPKWKPGEQAGKAVRVRYQIPIHFVYRN